MTSAEWGIMIGVVMSTLLALAPWMFMVHAKLAVLATQMCSLEEKADRLIEADQQRVPMCATHAARLESMDVQITHISDRLREVE